MLFLDILPHLLCIAVAERSLQKSASTVGDAMLMRSKEAKVAGHGYLISVHVMTLCACVEWWPNDEAGYARVQMTSSCVAQWHQSSSSNTTAKIEDAWKNWSASLCPEKRRRFSHDRLRKTECFISWGYRNIRSKLLIVASACENFE